MAITEVV